MLSEDFELDLVTTRPEAFGPTVSDHYSIYGKEYPTNRNGHARSLLFYLSHNSPNVVLSPTRPVLYGTLLSTLTFGDNISYVYRHSGEVFQYYKQLTGWKKALCYGVRNLGGNVPLLLAEQYIALGPEGKRRLVEKGISPEEISILPPTISANRFEGGDSGRPEPLKSVDRDVVLFIGRRTRMKGVHVLEKAIPRVLDERDDLQFVFVGGGDRQPVVPADSRDHVTIVGAVPPAEIPSYLSAADLLVLPSLSEGVPRVLLEALYKDTPVLASDVGDVAMITDNTYQTFDEFVEKLIYYDRLDIDPIDKFMRSSAKQGYVEFFENEV